MSDRFADSFLNEAVPLQLLCQRAYNLRWAEQAPGVIPLTAADPDFPAAPAIRDAIADYARSGVFSYGPAGGLPSFRESVARYLRQRGAPVSAAGVVAVNSAAAGLALVARHWLSPGDEAIVLDPVDFLFAHTVRSAGGVPVLWRIDPQAPLDLAALEALVTSRTRVLCLCNPHNPLGRCFRRDELEALGRFCLERGLRVLSDEVWSDVVYPPATFTSWLAMAPELAGLGAVVHGFSKSFGLAGLRVGYVAMADPEAAARLLADSELPSTVDGVATLSQVAATAAYGPEGLAWLAAFLRHLQARRDQAVTRLAAIPGLRVHPPAATFVLFVGLPPLHESVEELVERLRREHGVAVVPGSPRWFGPGAAGHLRLSFATSEALLAEGLNRLAAGLASAAAPDRLRPPGRGSAH
ncbi:pyridoxal phosphate-dependent aminotransferase [Synechococcus sp. CCY 0621]|uniref:pyridoxal phosphate-dependent aminotransferase n=1 Tax=Synechococcus sp. CCY 0621 TaxID=2815603 RepID=UPI001C239E99|nr:pyridoxal phosphate-dependent aminotransferase [Synechococcus sp. CCY 0621]